MGLRRGPSKTGGVETGGSEDDVALVLRAIVDRRAFEPLYRKYLMPVYGRCFGHLRDADEAWDATSQTFAKAFAGLDGFAAGAAFAPWLFRIADNCCHDVVRVRTRHPTVPLPDGLDFEDARPDPEETAVAEDDRRRLEEALTKLPPRRERIVRLHLAGLKGREIAARLGISHDLVRKEQERAIEDLGRLLGIDRDGEVRHG